MNDSKLFILALTSLCVLTQTALAGPAGKPFVEINGQITEVQGDVATLEEAVADLIGAVETLEERATSAEAALVSLMDETDALQAQIDALSADVVANADEIANLTVDVEANAAMISTLQDELLIVQHQLELRQKIIAGSCEEGYFMVDINPDGSVVCREDIGTEGPVGGSTFIVVNGYELGAGTADSLVAECPADTQITGGGFDGAGFEIMASKPVSRGVTKVPRKKSTKRLAVKVATTAQKKEATTGDAWQVEVRNIGTTTRPMFAYAVCVGAPEATVCRASDVELCGGEDISCLDPKTGECVTVCSTRESGGRCARRACKRCS